MDDRTAELRQAHDAIAEIYVQRLANLIDEMPIERALLGLFRDFVLVLGGEPVVADVGCGTGRLTPYLHQLGLAPTGVDLSPEMVRVARRDYPGFEFEVGDARSLPYADASLAGAVCWYSLMYLPPEELAGALHELVRVLRPGGYVAMAYKAGDDSHRRSGHTLGVAFDIWWRSPEWLHRQLEECGLPVVFWAGRPADPDELQPQGYLIAQKR